MVLEAGVEAAAGVGEADLRRLKRQFSSLKNTFLHYEVKNEFLAGLQIGLGAMPTARLHPCVCLCRRYRHRARATSFKHDRPSPAIVAELLDGRPHGDEGELLQHFEAEVEASIAQLRQLKAANEGTQGAISDVVAQVRGSWLQSAVACLLVCAG